MGPLQGVFWLPALDPEPALEALDLAGFREHNRSRVKQLYALARAAYDAFATPGSFLISAARMGGFFGHGPEPASAPLGGGVLGFTKALKRERPNALVKAVDFESAAAPAGMAQALLAGARLDQGIVEVGHARGRRFTLTLEERPARDGGAGLTLDKDTVFVVTGAAGGITSAIERAAPGEDVHSILARLRAEFRAFPDANVFAFNVPPIIGLGTGGGFEYQLEDLRGGKPVDLAAVARGLVVAANQDPKLSAVFTSYSANTPQLYLDLDRDKVQTLGVSVEDVFNALQATLGGFYTNDFNLFGRTWQVNVQAEGSDRDEVPDIFRIHVRNANGEMVPLRSVAETKLILGPQTVARYNNYQGIEPTL